MKVSRNVFIALIASLALTIMDWTPGAASSLQAFSINTYQMGTLTPVSPLTIPTLSSSSNNYSAELPVIRVRGSYAVEIHPLASPKKVLADVPTQLARQLAAYFVQMNQTTSFYLIGPRKMKGQAELGTDGSFDVFLKNSMASIELDTPGGSELSTWSLAAPFFSAAKKSLEQNGVGQSPSSTQNTTIQRPNPHTALFAFIDQNGSKVGGYSFYQSNWYASAFGGAAQMVYLANSEGWKYATWTLNSAIAVLDNIGEPQIGGKVLPPHFATNVSRGPYFPAGSAISLDQHIIWLQHNVYVQRGSTSTPSSSFPIAPFLLMEGAYRNGKLIPNSGVELAEIPWMKSYLGDNKPLYDYPFLLHLTGGRFLPYIEIWAGYGMNQPATNNLYVFDLKSHRNQMITSFPLFGGTFFSVGTIGDELVYDKSGIIDAKGDFGHHLWLVNLATGKSTHLPTSDLHGQTVIAKVNGKSQHIPLTPID